MVFLRESHSNKSYNGMKKWFKKNCVSKSYKSELFNYFRIFNRFA
jgi:hypothetical protein